jgi:hypothetical protein
MNLKVEMFWKKGHQTVDDKKTKEISGRILASFGLSCLKKSLKNRSVATETEDLSKQDIIDRFDPFVPLVLSSFKTYHSPIVMNSLGIIASMLSLGLPSFKATLTKFLNKIFKLFGSSETADTDLINTLFKTTQELIRTSSIYSDLS